MKNFNRCSSHGHHGSKSKRRELAQYAHSHGLHAFTHTLTSTVTTTVVRSASSANMEFGMDFFYFEATRGKREQTGVPGENPRQPTR